MNLDSIRITAATVMASAVCDLFPETHLIASHATQEGFFCDFETEQPLDQHALPLIEEKMRGLIKADLPIEQREMMRENAAELFRHYGLDFKVDQVLRAETPTVAVAHLGKFCDYLGDEPALLPSIGSCRAFKVLKIQRETRYCPERGEISVVSVRGTVCLDLKTLKGWLKAMKAAAKREHRLLGTKLKLFAEIEDDWFWLPKGVELREALQEFWKEAVKGFGFQIVTTPSLFKEPSDISFNFEERSYAVLPDRAAAHARLFALSGLRRLAEMSQRFFPLPREKTEGLLMSRLQMRDALHLFAFPDEALATCISSLHFFDQTIKIFNFEPKWVLVDSRPIHAPVRAVEWRPAVQLLLQAAEGAGMKVERSTQLSEYGPCYGPHLEMRLSDSLGRMWPVASLGVDLYHLRQGGVMLEGSLFGSLERFIALLLEKEVDLNRILRSVKRV